MKYILLFSIFASTCFSAMTPQEKKLVSGLSSQNDELREIVTDQDKQIEKFQTDARFANQKIESLESKLKEAGDNEKEQLKDLAAQQIKIHAMAKELDDAYIGWNKAKVVADKKTAEAHRNAVERDICLFLAAIAGTVLVLIYGGQIIGFICRKFPILTPYGIGLWIALAILSFGTIFATCRLTVALIASKL
ncbi:MAG: hypothetical protein WC069_06410 [Candidatus Shapirobacteria bacterium]|nr:hypothetical protein [Terrimicrobiaceae bacterium]